VGGRVAEGGSFTTVAAAARAVAVAAPGAAFAGRAAPPCERSAADRVINREPQPGHVITPSGSVGFSIGLLQRGQFMGNRKPSIS
jgi:hypothetical protein